MTEIVTYFSSLSEVSLKYSILAFTRLQGEVGESQPDQLAGHVKP